MVFFDAGETLVHPLPSFPELFSSCCREFGLEVDLPTLAKIGRTLMAEVEEKQRLGFTFTDDHEASRAFWLGFYRSLVGAMGYEADHDELPEELYRVFSLPSNYGAYPDAGETLEALRAAGMRMGLISNFEGWLQDLLDMLGITHYFEVLVISGKVGFEKPNPRIYELALERAGVQPGSAIHVGDSPVSDFDGAAQVGMRSILLDRWDRFPDFEGARISRLSQVMDFLDLGDKHA
jgi:putative hydrolase of the HAD superfamily